MRGAISDGGAEVAPPTRSVGRERLIESEVEDGVAVRVGEETAVARAEDLIADERVSLDVWLIDGEIR